MHPDYSSRYVRADPRDAVGRSLQRALEHECFMMRRSFVQDQYFFPLCSRAIPFCLIETLKRPRAGWRSGSNQRSNVENCANLVFASTDRLQRTDCKVQGRFCNCSTAISRNLRLRNNFNCARKLRYFPAFSPPYFLRPVESRACWNCATSRDFHGSSATRRHARKINCISRARVCAAPSVFPWRESAEVSWPRIPLRGRR